MARNLIQARMDFEAPPPMPAIDNEKTGDPLDDVIDNLYGAYDALACESGNDDWYLERILEDINEISERWFGVALAMLKKRGVTTQ